MGKHMRGVHLSSVVALLGGACSAVDAGDGEVREPDVEQLTEDGDIEEECLEVVSQATSPATESVLLSGLSSGLPTSIVWEMTQGDLESEVVLSIARTNEGASVIERQGAMVGGSPACRAGVELRLPVTVQIEIDGSGVNANAVGALYAPDDSMVFVNVEADVVALDEAWGTEAEDAMGVGTTPSWSVYFEGALSEVAVSIEGRRRDDTTNIVRVLWRGMGVSE